MEEDMKHLVEDIIGSPVVEEKDFEETIIHHWLTFESGHHFCYRMNHAMQNLELYAEGSSEPSHVIPIDILTYLKYGGKVYVHVCEQCLKELKEKPPNLAGFPEDGTDELKLKWVLSHLDRFHSPPYRPAFIGKSIIIKTPYDEEHIRRRVFCTKPGTNHHIDSIIGKDDVNWEVIE